MSTKVQIQDTPALAFSSGSAPTLRRAFIVNAAVSLIFGLLMLFDSSQVAAFLGIQHMQFFGGVPAASILLDLGLVVIAFAAWVAATAARRTIYRPTAIAILVLDSIWVIDSAFLLVTNALPLTTPGMWAVLVAADLTLTLAVWEFIGIRRMAKGK